MSETPPPGRRRASRRGPRRRRIRFDLRKAMFVLPNLFTVSNIFCGFYAISLCLDSPAPIQLYRAALAIFFGMFFDMFDGRVARLTRTQSEFGVQLDSLADLVSFGAAPSILLFRWSLHEAGFVGLFCAFLFMLGGALRLARFNVLAAHETGPSKHFVGLPIPLAAGTVVSMVMASYPFERSDLDGALVIALGHGTEPIATLRLLPSVSIILALTLAGLMVSNVRYRTFKDLKLNRKSATIIFVIATVFLAISAQMKPAFALSSLFIGYIFLGLFEELVFFPARSSERRAKRVQRIRDERRAERADKAEEPAEDDDTESKPAEGPA